MVATADIRNEIARLLVQGWSGTGIVELGSRLSRGCDSSTIFPLVSDELTLHRVTNDIMQIRHYIYEESKH